MIHFRKRLSIFEIIKSYIFPQKINLSHWQNNNDHKSILLSKSSWSILLVAIFIKFKKKGKEPIFLVPDYYCNYSLNLLRILGSKIIFYKINENFDPDFSSIKNVEQFDVLIATHYFGKAYDFNKLSDYCKSKKKWLIEDATHCLKKTDKIGNFGHFTLYSQHKFFSCLTGALLILNNKKLSEEEISFFKNKNNSINLLKKFISDKKIPVYNNNFRIFFNLIYDIFIKVFRKEKIESFENDDFIQKKYFHPEMDYISVKLLSYNSNKIEFLSDYRNRCHLIIENYLERNFDQNDYEVISNINQNPYLFIIKSKNKTKEIYYTLQNNGLAIQTWPDLPKEVKKYSYAFFLRNHLIFIPLNKICLKKFSSLERNNNLYSFKIKECSEKIEWNNLINNYETNILQTWEFGNFKNNFLFAKIKRYLINDNNKNLIGFFQSIHYQLFFFKIIFINRGPIFKEDYKLKIKKNITEKIIEILKKNLFTFILIMPELEFSKENILINYKNKFTNFRYPSWSSSRINLLHDKFDIFKNLKSSLRNEITKAEKILNIDLSNKDENANWIYDRYFSDENKKKFKTISKDLIKHLNKNNILSICAKKDNNICSGIIIYCHGKSATYLMSYNTDEGRKSHGNQILLWEAIKYLKNKNYSTLDLGGIDTENNLSVAKFKLAFNGKLYKLVGASFI